MNLESGVDPDDLIEDPDGVGGEDESDLDLGASDNLDAVVVATDWTAETLLSQIRRGNIQLDPEFQRRDAWDRTRKSRFIESLVVGLPVPQIVLAEKPKQRNAYIVLDGKQRLLTLTQFAAGDDEQPLLLSRLELRRDLNGFGYEDMPPSDRTAFDNQTIRTVVVRNWKSDKFLFAVFLRLNTGNLPLSPQELRQALHPGGFVRFASEFTSSSESFRDMLGLTRPDFRMRDVELLVRYFGFSRFLPEYSGNLKPFLDGTCERLNEEWTTSEAATRKSAAQCVEAIDTTLRIFEDDAFRRWNETRYERPFNRAVFDVMVFYFREKAVRTQAEDHAKAVREAFQLACCDQEFAAYLSRTTKTIEAIQYRLQHWGKALERAIGGGLPIPSMENGRIRY